VVSFRNSRQLAIAANRVLLGTAVGLISPPTRTTRDIIKAFGQDINLDRVPDGQVDPLLAVTLSDLLGIDAGAGLVIPAGQILFGAEGEWNSTACQTSYKLKTNGTLATLAELREGLDGWNIGRKLPEILAKNPKITLSQILRMYYSARGLTPDSGVCNRQYGITTDLQNKIPREAENYIRIWNGVYYSNANPDNQLTGFVEATWNIFNKFLQKAGQDKTIGNSFPFIKMKHFFINIEKNFLKMKKTFNCFQTFSQQRSENFVILRSVQTSDLFLVNHQPMCSLCWTICRLKELVI
jgi:hypothetical protein